jgi:hypothetical protein
LENSGRDSGLRFCGNCGKNLLPNATFCAYCGAEIPKLAALSPVYKEIPKLEPSIHQIEPLRPFLQNFTGIMISPKKDFPQIITKPNLSQPFILNVLIGFLSAITLVTYFNKIPIRFSQSFIDSFLVSPGLEDMDPSEFISLFTQLIPIFTPIFQIISWVLYSLILWILIAVFASDLVPQKRNFKTMMTITGWSQLPTIFLQLIMIVYNLLLLPSGEIIFHSMFEIETIIPVPTPQIIDFLLVGVEFFILFWRVFLIYYAVKSLASINTNVTVICIVYGIIVFLMPAFTMFP